LASSDIVANDGFMVRREICLKQDFPVMNGTNRRDCGIAIMAKASVPGRTKTRLVPPLSLEQAAALNTAFLQDMASNLLAAGNQASITGYVAFAPAHSQEFFRSVLPFGIGLIEVDLPSLGDCLQRTIDEIFARGHVAAVVLNSDSPTLPTALLVETARSLARPGDRAVLGPTIDGGYYLLGLKTAHHRLFEDISWSTERVAAQTLERARELELDVHMLSAWYDVDDRAGLRKLRHELPATPATEIRPIPQAPYYPIATACFIRDLSIDERASGPETDPTAFTASA
jgi:rSAM/selenodomain-associated transferase 1